MTHEEIAALLERLEKFEGSDALGDGDFTCVYDAATALRQLMAENQRLKKALKPFSQSIEEWGDDLGQPDRWDVWEHPIAIGVTIGDFRQARAAIGGTAVTDPTTVAADPIMGTLEDAETALIAAVDVWIAFRQPSMDTAAGHRKREFAEVEAQSRLANAAALWAWFKREPNAAARAALGEQP